MQRKLHTFKQRFGICFHQQLLPAWQAAFKDGDLAKQQKNIPWLSLWTEMSGQAAQRESGTTEPKVVDSFPLCKEAAAYCPTLRCALTAFWSWKQTRGLSLCLRGVQSCRRTVLKWKAKRGCFSAKCFSSQPSRPLFKLSKSYDSHPHFSSYSFPLSLSSSPSFLALFASMFGRSHLSGRVWQTVGRTPQDVGSVEESVDGLRAKASLCITERTVKDEQDNVTALKVSSHASSTQRREAAFNQSWWSKCENACTCYCSSRHANMFTMTGLC